LYQIVEPYVAADAPPEEAAAVDVLVAAPFPFGSTSPLAGKAKKEKMRKRAGMGI